MTVVSLSAGLRRGQLAGQLVGLPGRGAVADRHQLDVVGHGQLRQCGQRGVPGPARLVRVDRVGGHHLAGGVDHRDLHPGAQAGVQAHRRPAAGGCGEQQVAQVGGEHPDRALLGDRAQPDPDVDTQVQQDAGAPGPAHRIEEPPVGRATPVGDAEGGRDGALVVGHHPGLGRRGVGLQGDVEHVLLLTAERGQDPVRRQRGERLGEVEVVANFDPSDSLPSRTRVTSRPRVHIRSRSPPIRSASSANRSTRMALAPSSAAAASATGSFT